MLALVLQKLTGKEHKVIYFVKAQFFQGSAKPTFTTQILVEIS
jgi:hypothetical protein